MTGQTRPDFIDKIVRKIQEGKEYFLKTKRARQAMIRHSGQHSKNKIEIIRQEGQDGQDNTARIRQSKWHQGQGSMANVILFLLPCPGWLVNDTWALLSFPWCHVCSILSGTFVYVFLSFLYFRSFQFLPI